MAVGLAGLEFLSGIPGTIGGAVKMNAGAYGREIVDIIESATIVTREGRVRTLDKDALGLSYRKCWLVVDALNRTFESTVIATYPGRAKVLDTRQKKIARTTPALDAGAL